LHAPLLLMRRATGPVQLAGVDLPAGTEVAFSPDAVHHDPRWYPDSERFDPDRWLPNREPLPPGAYVPFGDGSRKCIGDAFAWTEMAITLATVLARWRLTAVPGRTPREVTSVIPRPDALPMIISVPCGGRS
jgi:cytochrome P450